MKKFLLLTLITAAMPTHSFANRTMQRARCADDLISFDHKEQAEGRIRWFAKCYIELVRRSSWGNDDQEIRNNWINQHLYKGSNPKNGYLPVISFPVFTDLEFKKTFVAPKVESASCDGVPKDVYPLIECEEGCMARGMRLLTSRGWTPAGTFDPDLDASVTILAEDSTLDHPKYAQSPILRFTEDLKFGWQKLVVIEAEGRSLVVTLNHPLLLADGRLIQAQALRVGDQLLNSDMSPATITNIATRTEWTKAYNVLPRAEQPESALVLIEGFLSGTLYHQNEGLDLLNRQLLRRNIPEALLR